jgi:hypothetical protein
MTNTQAESFLRSMIKKTDKCIEWNLGRVSAGYGVVSLPGSVKYAHRMSFEIFNGKIPPNHKVLHRCDNPPCVNPRHLFSGTQKDNIDDMVKKGRHARVGLHGSKNGSAKLNEVLVAKIRSAKPGMSYTGLALRFGIPKSTAFYVCKIGWRLL